MTFAAVGETYSRANPQNFPANDVGQSQTRNGKEATPEKAEVVKAIDDAIGTLESPDYKQFIEYYAPVEFLRVVRRRPGGVTAFAGQAARNKTMASFFKSLQSQLGKARKSQPKFNGEKTIVTFEFVIVPERKLKAKELPFGKIRKLKLPVKGYGGNLLTAIDKARNALAAGDYADYLTNMLPVTDLQVSDVNKLAKQLKTSPAAVKQMIADLKLLESKTPKYSEKKTVALYRIKRPTADVPGRIKGFKPPDRVFKFQKVAGNWRLFDNTKSLKANVTQFRKLPAVQASLSLEKLRDHWRIAVTNREELRTWGELYNRLSRPRGPKKTPEKTPSRR